MHSSELIAVGFYLSLVFCVGYFSYRKSVSAKDFIIGGRSLNYWLTALAAHASDMSSWLFMGYPSLIFLGGIPKAWAGIGLILMMYLNWELIAPKLRKLTEEYESLTFSSFFEKRIGDSTGRVRIFTAIMQLFFFTIYIAGNLYALGILGEILFKAPYLWGITFGILLVIPYVLIGGYRTLAWIDLFQGTFLMLVIVFVPLFVLSKMGGLGALSQAVTAKNISLSLFPDFSFTSIRDICLICVGWGLGYFGQPHIITKFMGIRKADEIRKSKWVGMSWMTLALGAATFVGIVGVGTFGNGLANPEHVFITMVRSFFSPFWVGFFLCAVIAATINTISSQVLVLTSSLTEDFYKKMVKKSPSEKEQLLITRCGVILSCLIAYAIAWPKMSSVYGMVFYAWSGLGCAFGPLLLFSLYFKRLNKQGAWGGILVGGVVSAIWPACNDFFFNFEVPSMVVGFSMSSLAIFALSLLTQEAAEERSVA